MRWPTRRSIAALLAAGALLGACDRGPSVATASAADGPAYGDPFWATWGDGRAEIATYDLTFVRYGEPREGTATTIFVTETFSEEARVKVDGDGRTSPDEFPVMKLNLVQDFPTGIYDYNLMASSFVGLEASGGRAPGALAKSTFSSQEWCGQVFHVMRPETDRVRWVAHSYFADEADESSSLSLPDDALFEDALFHWARGFAGPSLEPGASREVSLVTSSQRVRLAHVELETESATLNRSAEATTVEVPAGSFEVDEWAVDVGGDRSWRFLVERDGARRIVVWETSDGGRAELVASQRLKYWEMNGAGGESALGEIGLDVRPPRTP